MDARPRWRIGLYEQRWGFAPLTTTLVFAVYAVAALVAVLVAGQVSDVVGRKPLLLGAAHRIEALAGRQQAGAVECWLAGGQLQRLLAVEARAPQQVQPGQVRLAFGAEQVQRRLGLQARGQALSHGPTSRHRGGAAP